jgi:transposase
LTLDAAQVSLRHIAFLDREVARIEQTAEPRCLQVPQYERLLTVPGIGKILGMTIILETGPVTRFAGPGPYASYCRLVKAEHTSNGQRKGGGNVKNGNAYLAWAYLEAVNGALRASPELRAWYERKATRANRMIAWKAMAHKLAKACYFILRDGAVFDVKRLVG